MTGEREVSGDVAEQVTTAIVARRGHVVYESGHHGDLWLDLDGLFRGAARTAGWAAELAQRLPPVDAIAGPLTGGAFLALQVAARLGVDFVYADRLEGGAGVGYRIPARLRAGLAGQRVALVDDAINAGSATVATLEDLHLCGATVSAIGALVLLGDAAERLTGRHPVPVHGLATLHRRLWTPQSCPLCGATAEPAGRQPGAGPAADPLA